MSTDTTYNMCLCLLPFVSGPHCGLEFLTDADAADAHLGDGDRTLAASPHSAHLCVHALLGTGIVQHKSAHH